MKGGDYLNIIEPKKRIEKVKEIKFIFNNFFFKEISIFLFEKNYFHLFSFHEFKKDEVITTTGEPLKDLIFIKDGEVSMDMKSSVVNIHNLIKYLYEYIFNNKLFNKLPQNKQNKLLNTETIETIKEYINEPIFKKLKGYSIKFNEEINKKRNFKISTLGQSDILGLEELYLKISSITKITVLSKKLSGYKLSEEHLDQILGSEKYITMSYLKNSINKIVTLIQRLQHIKTHYINYFIQRYEKNVDNEEIKDLAKNNNGNINDNFSYKLKKQISDNNLNISGYNEFNFQNSSIINNYNNFDSKNSSLIKKSSNISNIKINGQLSNKTPNKKLLIKYKKSHKLSKNLHINIKSFDNNKIRFRNNFDYNNDMNIDKRQKTLKTTKCFNYGEKTKKNILIGDKTISIKKLKNQINEIQSLGLAHTDLIQIIQSNKYNNFNNNEISKSEKSKDDFKKDFLFKGSSNYLKYRLSYVPLYNNKNNQLKINTNLFNTESITSNCTPFQLTIFSNNSNNNNQPESRNYNIGNNINYDSFNISNRNQLMSIESSKNRQNNKFLDSYNNSRNIPKIFNLKSQEKIKGHINEKIKAFYKELKAKGCLSYVPNGEKNTFFTRKFNKKYKSASKNLKKNFTSNSSQADLNVSKKFLPIIKKLIN